MILNYFKQQKKPNSNFIQPKSVEINQLSDSENYYQSCLQQTECEKSAYILKSALNTQLSELEEKCKRHEEAVELCKTVIDDKNEEIKRLEKMLGISTLEIEAKSSTESVAGRMPSQMNRMFRVQCDFLNFQTFLHPINWRSCVQLD